MKVYVTAIFRVLVRISGKIEKLIKKTFDYRTISSILTHQGWIPFLLDNK